MFFFSLFKIIQISLTHRPSYADIRIIQFYALIYTHHIVSTRLNLSRKVPENQPGMAAYNVGYEIYTLYGLYRVNVCHVFIQNQLWEPGPAQVTDSYSRHLPALGRFFGQTNKQARQTDKQRLQLYIYSIIIVTIFELFQLYQICLRILVKCYRLRNHCYWRFMPVITIIITDEILKNTFSWKAL